MKRALKILGILIALLVVTALVLPFVIDANQFRPRLESEMTQALGREVKLGNLKLALLSGGVGATDLSIADDPAFSKQSFLTAKELKVSVDLEPLLFSRKLNVTGIEIDQPQIALIQNAEGTWNFASIGGKKDAKPAPETPSGPAPEFSVKLLKISNGQISMQRAGDRKPQVLEKLDIEIHDFAPHAAFPFSLTANVQGGGDIKLDGKAGPISDADASATPFEAHVKVTKLNVVQTGFVKESTGFGGLVSLDGTVNSTGKSYTVKGDVDADQLKLSAQGKPATRSVGFTFAVQHDNAKRSGVLQQGNIHIGKAKAALTGNYRTQSDDLLIDMKLAAPAMEVEELEAMLPSLNIVLPQGSSLKGGAAHVNVTVQGPTDALAIKGSAGLTKTQLSGFDLGSKMRTVATLAGIKISPNTDFDNVSADVNSNPKGTAIDNISIVAPAIGQLIGAGTISPSQALDFKMRANLIAEGGVMGLVGAKQAAIPFSIQGTSSEPKFIPDVRGAAAGVAAGIVGGVTGGKVGNIKDLKKMTPDEAGKAAGDIMNLFRKKKN
ncbi:MAG: AsmA family protein [Bryobacteraceae bacterium]